MSDEELTTLLARAREGDAAAQAEVHRAVEERLKKSAHRLLGRVLRRYMDSMDIVQSAQRSLLIGMRGKYATVDGGQLIALALRILQRKVARRWGKLKWEAEKVRPLVTDPPAPPQGDGDGIGGDPPPLQKLMKRMSQTEKALVELRLQGHTTASAARQLGLDPGYARVLLGRMRERLGAMFPGCEDLP